MSGRASSALLLRALAVGLAAGAAALLLRWAVTEAARVVWPGADLVAGVAAAAPWRRVVVPAAGGLVAGLVLALGTRWAGAARGWDILEAVVLRNGVLPLRSSLVRAASSLFTQASAGAVGREGPIVLLAAATASQAAQRLKVPARERRVLVGCGIAAGLACAYNTPLGAALFTMEIIFGSFAADAFAALAVASTSATLLTWIAFGRDPVFRVPQLVLENPWEAVAYAVLGLAAGGVAAAFLFALRASAAAYRRLGWPRPLAMASAGLVLGLVTLGWPELVGNGREAIAALFERPWAAREVLVLLLLRLAVTPLAVGSGTVGGVFTPTLFVGAMLGYGFGSVVHAVAPALAADPSAYALVGMGSVLAGTTHAPLTSVVMVFEMTLDYGVVVPLLLGAALASLVASRFSATSVYTEALQNKAAAEGGAALETLRVGDLMRREEVVAPGTMPLSELLRLFVVHRRNHVYLVEATGRLEGVVNLHDASEALRDSGGVSRLRARDVVRSSFETTTPDEPLARVLERFSRENAERLPVVADAESRRLVGTVSKRDILAAWVRQLEREPFRRDSG